MTSPGIYKRTGSPLGIIILLLLLLSSHRSFSQADTLRSSVPADTSEINKKRLAAVLAVQGSLYVGSLTGLYFLWYKDYPQSSFHFFDDRSEWMQMDKMGHMTSAYYISMIGNASYRWAGIDPNRAAIFGGLLGYAYLLNVEILDGFSAEWGFSVGDLIANTAGCGLFVGQQLGWKEQRFLLKYSFHTTRYAQYNEDLLGSSLIQQMVKDYNGMTFWLSGNIGSFLPERSRFPRWINVSFGYGAEGMTGANSSTSERYRQFYLSMDVDLTRIKTKSKFLKGLFTVVNFIKVPFPAIEFNTLGQVKFHYLYF